MKVARVVHEVISSWLVDNPESLEEALGTARSTEPNEPDNCTDRWSIITFEASDEEPESE